MAVMLWYILKFYTRHVSSMSANGAAALLYGMSCLLEKNQGIHPSIKPKSLQFGNIESKFQHGICAQLAEHSGNGHCSFSPSQVSFTADQVN